MADIFLHPGDLRFAEPGTSLRTVLGSCLAIVMWHPARRIGGMSHCLLPCRASSDRVSRLDARYVDEALPLMFVEAVRRDTDPNDYRIKLFGGSKMIAALHCERRSPIGDLNARTAVLNLSRLGLAIAARDLGGTSHRSLVFEVESGAVWVRTGTDASRDTRVEAALL